MPAKLRETPAQPWRASALQNFALACITLLGQSSKTGVVSELKDQSEKPDSFVKLTLTESPPS